MTGFGPKMLAAACDSFKPGGSKNFTWDGQAGLGGGGERGSGLQNRGVFTGLKALSPSYDTYYRLLMGEGRTQSVED